VIKDPTAFNTISKSSKNRKIRDNKKKALIEEKNKENTSKELTKESSQQEDSKKSTKPKKYNKPKQNQNFKNKQKNKGRKVFVIDTNIILNDYMIPFSFKSVDIVLPQMVIHELDKKQDFAINKSVAYNARAFGRKLRTLLKEQKSHKIKLKNDCTITLERTPSDISKIVSKLGLEAHKPDSIIIACAAELKEAGRNVTLLSNDTNMYVSASLLNIDVEDYQIDSKKEKFFTGVSVFTLKNSLLIHNIYEGKSCFLTEKEYPELYVNQIVILKGDKELAVSIPSVLTVFKGYDKPLERIKYSGKDREMKYSGISPLNKEQAFAFHLLSDSRLSCVTLSGKAGTGKSIVTLSYAIENLGTKEDKDKFEKILIVKPIIPVGKDVGFLPGTLEEKLDPWIQSFMDSLDVIFDHSEEGHDKGGFKVKEKPYKELLARGIIQFQPLTFMRGRSIQKTLVILDEAQGTSLHEMKTLLTRIGEGSKIICLGDIDQIDAPYLDKNNNGLTYLIERAKTAEIIGHIELIKSQRSALADWAADNL